MDITDQELLDLIKSGGTIQNRTIDGKQWICLVKYDKQNRRYIEKIKPDDVVL